MTRKASSHSELGERVSPTPRGDEGARLTKLTHDARALRDEERAATGGGADSSRAERQPRTDEDRAGVAAVVGGRDS